jgi:hypothetical protein
MSRLSEVQQSINRMDGLLKSQNDTNSHVGNSDNIKPELTAIYSVLKDISSTLAMIADASQEK